MSAQKHILVVDDSAELRETVSIILSDAGYQVTLAENGEEALSHLASGAKPDAILLDVLMPGMDGPEFLARLRERDPASTVRVGVMTGIASSLVAKLLRPDAFLIKPFGDHELLQAVRELLRGSR